jgi:aryl-alcohol dehydrogenase-like predicted oxidoreductase
VADQLGATSSQVAIAWTRAHSRAVHPILGVRSLGQLQDNLGGLEVTLPADAVTHLEAAASFELGFPRTS